MNCRHYGFVIFSRRNRTGLGSSKAESCTVTERVPPVPVSLRVALFRVQELPLLAGSVAMSVHAAKSVET